ncbi:MAG TPA: hypothetical protein VMM35_01040 [Longimicrobiales bacterium]|nr:hypothetical protein [Longimicrobiales bacterium]
MTMRALALCACLLAHGAPVCGQSIFNSAGMGLPIEPLDGRARALGSFGIGLQGPALLPTDPAAAARVPLPTGVIAAQPSWVELSQEGSGQHVYHQGTRFPLLGLAYRSLGGTLTLQFSSVFDQGYTGESASDVVVGGTPIPATDRFVQEGSVSSLAAGYARMLGPASAFGVSIGRYSGRVDRTLTRHFDGSSGLGAVDTYISAGSWRYSGWSVTGGASTELLADVRVAASATWSTDLEAHASGFTEGSDRSFSVPLQLRVGASSVLTQGLAVSASAVRADWTVAADDVGGATRVRTVYGAGVGIELSQARLFGREAPLRVGFRRTGLPFSVGGGDGTEQVYSGGLALVLNESNGVVLATTDLGVERGRRTGGIVTEDFWRATISLRLSAF